MSEQDTMEPIPVRVVGEEEEAAATFGSWVKHALTGTSPARQILPQDDKRKRAVIIVSGAAAQLVYVGTPGQTQSVATAVATAGELTTGAIVEVQSCSELWVIPDTTATDARVSVLVERYL